MPMLRLLKHLGSKGEGALRRIGLLKHCVKGFVHQITGMMKARHDHQQRAHYTPSRAMFAEPAQAGVRDEMYCIMPEQLAEAHIALLRKSPYRDVRTGGAGMPADALIGSGVMEEGKQYSELALREHECTASAFSANRYNKSIGLFCIRWTRLNVGRYVRNWQFAACVQ